MSKRGERMCPKIAIRIKEHPDAIIQDARVQMLKGIEPKRLDEKIVSEVMAKSNQSVMMTRSIK